METIFTENAPKAIGPYSQAIAAEGFVFTAGNIGNDPKTGELVPGGIGAETRQALANIAAVLAAAGTSLSRVVKTTVFLADLKDFAAMNAAYAESFKGHCPARSTVQVAALPKGARVEIEAIARKA